MTSIVVIWMRQKEIYYNLFDVDDKYYFAHCISADFVLGKGIAVEFKKRFNTKQILLEQYPNGCEVGACLLTGKVFNLVTKEKYWQKPTYHSLFISLLNLKKQIISNDIKFIAIPQIGCGLDKLCWVGVQRMIFDIFDDVDISIVVCKLKR